MTIAQTIVHWRERKKLLPQTCHPLLLSNIEGNKQSTGDSEVNRHFSSRKMRTSACNIVIVNVVQSVEEHKLDTNKREWVLREREKEHHQTITSTSQKSQSRGTSLIHCQI